MSGYLARPPPGVESDWSRPGYADTIRDLCIALLVLNTLFVAARMYTRRVLLKSFGIDDCMCFIAYCLTTAQAGLVFKALDYGFARHAYDVPKSKAKGLYFSYFILGLLPGPIYLFIKLTFFLTYARIFNPATYMKWLIWIGVAVTTAFYLGDFLYDVFQCNPIPKAWDPTIPGHCAKEKISGGPTGIYNVISDLYILLLPMPMVWSLNTNWRRRLKLFIIFSLGAFTFAMSVTRLAETVLSSKKADHTYAVGPIFIWADLEWSVGLIVACMIVCPSLWDRWFLQPFAYSWARLSSAYRSMVSVRTESLTSRGGSDETKGSDIHKTIAIDQESYSV